MVVDSEMSDTAHVTSGIPKGSVLGLFLFFTFINSMPETVSTRPFADNSIIYREVIMKVTVSTLGKLKQWEKT